jgi:hypothetical protein
MSTPATPATPQQSAPLTFAWTHLVWIAVLAAVVALGGYEWVQEHDARLKAEASAAAQQKSIDAAKSDSAAKDQQIKDRDAVSARQQDLIARQADAIKSTAQAVAEIQKFQAAAGAAKPGNAAAQPFGPVTVAQRSDLTPEQQAKLPDAPSYSVFTQAQSIQLAQAQLACSAAQVALGTCQKDLIDANGKLADAQIALKQTVAQRDEYHTALKGGTWLHRTVTAAKWIVIGGAVGYAAARR